MILGEINQLGQELFNHVFSFTPYFISLAGFTLITLLARKIVQMYLLLQEPFSFLEVTPPAKTEQEAFTTEQLFSIIHAIGTQRTTCERLFGIHPHFSFELVSTKEKGIRYIVRTPKRLANTLTKGFISYLPHLKVEQKDDYLPKRLDTSKQIKIVEFKLSKHFAFPLKHLNELDKHDPVAYITGMMTKLSEDDFVTFQIVLAPTNTKRASLIKRKILQSDDVIAYLNGLNGTSRIAFLPLTVLSKLISVVNGVVNMLVADLVDNRMSARQAQMMYASQNFMNGSAKPKKILNKYEQELVTSVQQKVDQPLFAASIRIFVSVNNKQDLLERITGLQSSLGVFAVPGYQSFKKISSIPLTILEKIKYLYFQKRLIGFFNRNESLLSVTEVADLYHFPYTKITKTENIAKVHSRSLPAPLSLKNNIDLDIIFAKNTYGGTTTLIGLTREERARHMYVIGATGTGKSTMLLSMINQDLHNGNGVCIVDPHGDLAESAIHCIPDERINDLIYFNPFDIKYPIGINLLELTPGLEEDEALLEKEFIAESVISLFRKVFSDAWASHPHRIEYILRNTIHTAFTLENPTLFTIFDLLNNPVFQKQAIKNLQDENLTNFWKYEFGKAGDYQRVKMVAPVTARIGRFLFSSSAKRILEQEKSTINFDEILDNKKILICNLSKGNIGEDTSEVMGIMILNKIQLAALKRARVEKQKRSEFYLYVDEFQNFATPSFVQMLSEARKYGLSLTMAEQSTSQQKDRNLVDIILANTGTIVSFRSANPRDEQLLLPQFSPYVEPNELANLPSFHFYMKKAAIVPEEPFSGITLPIAIEKNVEKLEKLIESSRNLYAKEYISGNKSTPHIKPMKEDSEIGKSAKISSGLPA